MIANRFGTRLGVMLSLASFGLALSQSASSQTPESMPPDARVIVAQAASPAPAQSAVATPYDFPAYQRGVRAAAGQGPDALRRYVGRTRMIYAFYYNDFAPKE